MGINLSAEGGSHIGSKIKWLTGWIRKNINLLKSTRLCTVLMKSLLTWRHARSEKIVFLLNQKPFSGLHTNWCVLVAQNIKKKNRLKLFMIQSAWHYKKIQGVWGNLNALMLHYWMHMSDLHMCKCTIYLELYTGFSTYCFIGTDCNAWPLSESDQSGIENAWLIMQRSSQQDEKKNTTNGWRAVMMDSARMNTIPHAKFK